MSRSQKKNLHILWIFQLISSSLRTLTLIMHGFKHQSPCTRNQTNSLNCRLTKFIESYYYQDEFQASNPHLSLCKVFSTPSMPKSHLNVNPNLSCLRNYVHMHTYLLRDTVSKGYMRTKHCVYTEIFSREVANCELIEGEVKENLILDLTEI